MIGNFAKGSFLDISLGISVDTVSWQDSFPVEVTWHSRTDAGDRTTNSSWRLHAHTGTHLDAPVHHLRGAASVDELDPDCYLGRCRVMGLENALGDIGPTELAKARPRAGDRVLLRTSNSARDLLRRAEFASDYVGISAEGAQYLADVGIRLVGMDFLSVEPATAESAETHRILLEAGIAILEGLVLTEVAAGDYTLLFLPLPLMHADAAPGRAMLVPDRAEGNPN